MTVEIRFDASLSEESSGACFVIEARDQKHARQIATWLRSKVRDKTRCYITASIELPPQRVAIEIPDELLKGEYENNQSEGL